MTEFKTIDDILDFAIAEEEAAANFYAELAKTMEQQWMKDALISFSEEEKGHKKKLLDFKAGKITLSPDAKVTDLKIGDYLVDVTPNPKMGYQAALTVAMKKEKAAFKLYTDLASISMDAATRNVFLALAQEEAKHKLRFEIEYDDRFMTEN